MPRALLTHGLNNAHKVLRMRDIIGAIVIGLILSIPLLFDFLARP